MLEVVRLTLTLAERLPVADSVALTLGQVEGLAVTDWEGEPLPVREPEPELLGEAVEEVVRVAMLADMEGESVLVTHTVALMERDCVTEAVAEPEIVGVVVALMVGEATRVRVSRPLAV